MTAEPLPDGSIVIGLAGAHRGGTVAVVRDARVAAVCDQERVSRSRSMGLLATGVPRETLSIALQSAHLDETAADAWVVAEPALLALDEDWPVVDHHRAHATVAACAAPVDAIVIVCDRAATAPVSLWKTTAAGLRRLENGWRGPGFADVYAAVTRGLGLDAREEYKLEALARVGHPRWRERAATLVRLGDEGLACGDGIAGRVAAWAAEAPSFDPQPWIADVAATLQAHLADLLIAYLAPHARRHTLAVGGGLFHNTAFTTALARSGLFADVRVPIDPGNAGVAVGAALAHAGSVGGMPPSPFLGPAYDRTAVKAVLDNCKVSYDYVQEHGATERAVDALQRGHLVGWFTGRMEWGRRALGHRSILASPTAPYVLENLNRFLKHRAPHVAYGFAVCEEDAAHYFEDARPSPYMQFELAPKDPALFRGAIPAGASHVRVQTVGEEPAGFRRLLKLMGDAGLPPVVINTSFNGYREPIVCSPRDAVRAFYGTGLDVLAMEGFLLLK